MKHPVAVALVGIVAILIVALEVGRNLHGPAWAVWLASACVLLVALAAMTLLAKWADRQIARSRKGDSEPKR